MSLYDDLDVKARTTENVSGWSSGIKLLQSQLQLKKATVTQPKREQQRKVSLAPVIDLKSKRDDDDIYPTSFTKVKNEPSLPTLSSSVTYGVEYDWNVDDEYDPLWPNEFDKVVKELRENRERENDKEEKRRERKRKSRFSDPEEPLVMPTPQITQPPLASGFAGKLRIPESCPSCNFTRFRALGRRGRRNGTGTGQAESVRWCSDRAASKPARTSRSCASFPRQASSSPKQFWVVRRGENHGSVRLQRGAGLGQAGARNGERVASGEDVEKGRQDHPRERDFGVGDFSGRGKPGKQPAEYH
jgi:hypothetical protein